MNRLGRRSLLAIMSIVAALVLTVADHADARIGGGRSSFGSRGMRTYNAPSATQTAPSTAAPIQRSTTQPGFNQPGATTGMGGAAVNRPRMFGGGLLGGLAAGFIGAGLFGLLFGHGLFGGLGGLASMLGLFLQLGLVALIGMWLYRMWQSRRSPQPAYAGATPRGLDGLNRSGLGPTPMGGGLGSAGLGGGAAGGGPAPGAPSDDIGIQPADYQAFERLLTEIQTAYSDEDLNALRARATPEMVSYFAEELAENSGRGVVNKVTDVKLEQGDLAEAWREGDSEYATVAMRFSLVDRMIDRASGRMVGGSDARDMATEIWTFRRAAGGRWMVSAIQQTN